MTTILNTYYNNLQTALSLIDRNINATEIAVTDEYDLDVNYSDVLTRLYNMRRQVVRMLNIHKFLRLSKPAFLNELNSSDKVEVTHIVKDYETPLAIATQYGVTVSEILQTNNLTSSDITAGVVLRIQTSSKNYVLAIYQDIGTYGDQSGLNVLGTDLPDELVADQSTGDLKVLAPKDTIKQGILNRIMTKAGDYLDEPDFGMDALVGQDLPADLKKNMLYIKLLNQLSQETRITDVQNVTITTSQNSIQAASGDITVVNNATVKL